MPQTTETKTPWAELRVKTMTLERAREIGAPQGVAQCPACGAYLPIHEGSLNSPCPEPGCNGVLSVEVRVE